MSMGSNDGGSPPDAAALPADAVFDRNLLSGRHREALDLTRFERGNPVLPGVYDLDIYLMDNWVGRTPVRFASVSGHAAAVACITQGLLDLLRLPSRATARPSVAALDQAGQCVGIEQWYPGASAVPDMPELRLQLSVPQLYLGQPARGYVSPRYWDSGVSSAILNYNFNAYRSSNQGMVQTTAYLALGSGLNLGSWHLRNDASLNWMSTSGRASSLQWQDIDLYARHDVPAMRAQLTLGDSYTDGQVFDSFGIRGVQLATDDRMLPDSLRGYAPVIRGVANTNARIVVSQHGVQIYQATVAPGPFAITDLYPTGYGGSLDVSVTEADGSVRRFSVPYASVAQLLRPGISRFDVVLGQLRALSLQRRPWVLQGSYQRGFSNSFTGYAGAVAAREYAAGLLGGAFNTRWGALALDITQAQTGIAGYGHFSGQSVRISYSKIVPDTDTSFSVMAYRYSSSGFFSLTDAALAQGEARRSGAYDDAWSAAGQDPTGLPSSSLLTPVQLAALSAMTLPGTQLGPQGLQRARGSFTLSMSQRFGQRGGSLYANVSANDYWNRRGTDTQFQLGYNNRWWRFSYNLSATRTRDLLGRNDDQILLSVTLPLGSGEHAPTLGLNLSQDGRRGSAQQATVNGSLGAQNQYSYGATASQDEGGGTGSINGGYRGGYGAIAASYGQGAGYSQASLSVNGAVVAHPGGITFGQLAGDTLAVVHAPGAHGATVLNAAGAHIDAGGYALVPYLTPYNLNTIQLDPRGLPLDVELESSGAQVAPHAGAVVMVTFKTRNGRTAFARLHLPDGMAVPFGTELVDGERHGVGVVGQSGVALLRGISSHGRLFAHWHSDSGLEHDCQFDYRSTAQRQSRRRTDVPMLDLICEVPDKTQPAGGGHP
ncbi:fimbria/pilus outer membrane usher protein [Frateuria aurantia]